MKCPRCHGTGEIVTSDIGDRLRYLRELKGWSLRDLESATGISNPYLSQLETGKIKNPGIDHMMKLAALYGVTLDHLAGLRPLPESAPDFSRVFPELSE